jgi:hypothetical protein
MSLYIHILTSYGPPIIFHFLENKTLDMKKNILSLFTEKIFDGTVTKSGHYNHKNGMFEIAKINTIDTITYIISTLDNLSNIEHPVDIIVIPSPPNEPSEQIDFWITSIDDVLYSHKQRHNPL